MRRVQHFNIYYKGQHWTSHDMNDSLTDSPRLQCSPSSSKAPTISTCWMRLSTANPAFTTSSYSTGMLVSGYVTIYYPPNTWARGTAVYTTRTGLPLDEYCSFTRLSLLNNQTVTTSPITTIKNHNKNTTLRLHLLLPTSP